MTKKQKLVILGLAIIAFCSLSAFGLAAYILLRSDTQQPSSPVSVVTPTPAATATPASICTEIRFAKGIGPDSIDELLGEGDYFSNTWDFDARFDCLGIQEERITFKWFFNGKPHCTRTYISDTCDNSSLHCWSLGKCYISIRSKDYPDDLARGTYKLVLFVDGKEVTSRSAVVTK
jgi:hypothetical protein